MIITGRDDIEEIRVEARFLCSWTEDLLRSVEPRQVGGQQAGSPPGIRQPLQHIITSALRLRKMVGWDDERGCWTGRRAAGG